MHARHWQPFEFTLSIGITVALLFVAPLCGGDSTGTSGETSARPVLQSAAEFDYPPYSIVDEHGVADGFAVELLKAAAQAMGYDVNFRTGIWADVRGWLEKGEVEALPLVGRTPEREALFDFTFPYMSLHGAIVVRKDDTDVQHLEDLRGRKVAVMRGDNAEEFLRREERGIDIRTTRTFEQALAELSQGKHDAVVIQRLIALRLIQAGGYENLRVVPRHIEEFRQDFCFAVRKGDHGNLAMLNEGLALVIADGTRNRLHAKWFGGLELPDRKIIVGGDHNFPPYEFLNEQGLPAGYNVDLTRAIAERMGLNVEIRLGPWPETLRALENGDIDVIQGIFYSPERDRQFDFSQAHAVSHYIAVGRSGTESIPDTVEQLSGKRVVVQRDDFAHQYLMSLSTPSEVWLADTQEQALSDLAQGKYDLAIVNRNTGLHLIRENSWKDLVVSQRPVITGEYCFAVAKGRLALLAEFGEGLRMLRESGEYRRIHEEWLGVYPEQGSGFAAAMRIILVVAVPLFLLILLSLLWSWSLRRQVALRTDELRQNAQFIRRVLENLPVGIAVHSMDPSAEFTYMNDRFPEIYRSTKKALSCPDAFWETVFEDSATRQQFRTRVADDCNSGDPARMHWEEIPITRKGRRTTYISARNIPIPDQGLMISTVWDVTKELHLRQQLAQSQKLESIGRLAGGVAHDFNNMLSVIRGYVELMLRRDGVDPEMKSELHQIRTAAERSTDIIRQLLAFARKQSISPALLDLNSTIGNTLKMLRRLVSENIEIEWKPATKIDPVLMDPTQVDQILANLCVNARDAIKNIGKITIETRNIFLDDDFCAEREEASPGDYVLITVSDNGAGMSQEILDQIFEPFFTTKNPGAGTGLGLPMVYGIVRQNKGFISVCSEPGKGSHFWIYLPSKKGSAEELLQTRLDETPSGRGETILLVEDDNLVLSMASSMLKDLNYRVLAAGSPEIALQQFGEHRGRIDLIVTDVVMPGMNGKDLVNQLRAEYPELRCLFMSGFTSSIISPDEIRKAGTHFIQKPFSMSDLAVKIRRILDLDFPRTTRNVPPLWHS